MDKLNIIEDPSEDIVELTKQLISLPSITPKDAGCQKIIADRLEKLGFIIHKLNFGDVENIFALRLNPKKSQSQMEPIIAFAGHTDVVPPGNLAHWKTPPFTPTIKEGYLYGRGSADMKGSLAAMIIACERFLQKNPNPNGSIAFLITSDEEGDAQLGTLKIMEFLAENNIHLNYCIVGEPSSHHTLGDTIKNGRRGSITGRLKVKGIQGHVAYPDRADNPIHRIMKPLHALASTTWDQGSEEFPPTSFQISNIQAGTGAGNVIPGLLECMFNFRFSPLLTAECIQTQVKDLLNDHGLQDNLHYELEWQVFGKPFLTKPGTLTNACIEAIQEVVGITPQLSTTGGTSDARFIAKPNTEVIEIGPRNATIHSVNECVGVQELTDLTTIFERILQKLLE